MIGCGRVDGRQSLKSRDAFTWGEGSFHDLGFAMYNIVFAEVFKIMEWFFFLSIFIQEKIYQWEEEIWLTSWKQRQDAGVWRPNLQGEHERWMLLS